MNATGDKDGTHGRRHTYSAVRQPSLRRAVPARPGRAKYCSPQCREAAKKRRYRFRARRGGAAGQLLVPRGTPDPGDPGLAAERADDEQGIYAGSFPNEHESDVRFRTLIEQDAGRASRTSQSTWRAWRTYGRRHGVEHQEQTRDRVQRHQAEVEGRAGRLDLQAASGPQNRLDARTLGQVATKAAESRRLNARHADRLPPEPQNYDFEPPEQATGTFYRQPRGPGQRSRNADYRWPAQDGFIP